MPSHPTELAYPPYRTQWWTWTTLVIAAACSYVVLFGLFPHRPEWGDEPSTAMMGYAKESFAVMGRFGDRLMGNPLSAEAPSAHIADLSVRWAVLWAASLMATLTMRDWARLSSSRRYGARTITGMRYYEYYDAIVRWREALGTRRPGKHPRPLSLAPGVILPRRFENRTIMAIGLPGSGKSTFINSIALQVWQRGDRVVVADTDGEMVRRWPGSFFLLNPLHPQSHAWDVAADTVDEIAAREVMGYLIPVEGDGGHWARGAQEIGVGILRTLQIEYGARWGFAEWRDANALKNAALREFATRHHAPAWPFMGLEETGEFTKTAASYVGNYTSQMNTLVRPLADGWGDIDHANRVSLRQWLLDDQAAVRTLILQRSAEHPQISEAWLPNVLGVIAGLCASPSLPADESRRIWAILDEFPQLGVASHFTQMAEVGRKKGLCCLFATQGIYQLEKRYSSAEMKTFLDLAAFKVVFRLEPGPTTDTICTMLIPPSRMAYTPFSTDKTPAREEIATLPVIDAAEIAQLEQDPEIGVGGLVIHGGAVYRVMWRYPTMPVQRG